MPVGSHGDVHPFIGVALAMRARGHRVHACTSGYYAELFEAHAIPLDDVFEASRFRAVLDDPALWEPGPRGSRRIITLALEHAERQYAYLEARHGDPDLLVLASPLALGARVAQDRFALRLATLQLSPAAIPSVVDPPRVTGLYMPPWVPLWLRRAHRGMLRRLADLSFGELNRLRRRVGLPPARDIAGGWWNSPALTLALFPEWFSGRPPDWPDSVRNTGFTLYDEADVTPLDAGLQGFIEGCRVPPVAFTFGSAMTQGAALFAAAASACELLGRPGLLLTRHPEQLPAALPEGVVHVPYAPFSALAPRVAALVHHGGVGTMAQAFAAGTPQLVVPMAHDQFDNAHRVCRLEAGATIDRGRMDGAALADALDALLADPAIARGAAEAARRVAGDHGIARACELLEAMP